MICPNCKTPLTVEAGYKLHILHESAPCLKCEKQLSMEMLIIASFMKDYNTSMLNTILNLTSSYTSEIDGISFSAFRDYVGKRIKEGIEAETQFTLKEQKERRDSVRQNIDSLMKKKLITMTSLSLDLVPGKCNQYVIYISVYLNLRATFFLSLYLCPNCIAMYTQLDFVTKICSNYDYWTNPAVVQACINRYHKFLYLMHMKNGKMLVPTLDIDLAWHAHQTNPVAYREYTTQMTGRVVNHDDTISGHDLVKGYARTFVFWSQVYDEAYSTEDPDYTAWQRNHGVVSTIILPVGVYRSWIWKKHGSAHGRPVSDLPPQATLLTATPVSSSTSSSSSSPIVISAFDVHPVDETEMEDDEDVKGDEKGKRPPVGSNPRSVIGTPVNQSEARPNTYVNDWVLISMYSAPMSGCGGGGGCVSSGCGAAGGSVYICVLLLFKLYRLSYMH